MGKIAFFAKRQNVVRNMRKVMHHKKFFLIPGILLLLFSCKTENLEESRVEITHADWVDIPFVSVDTFYLSNRNFNLLLTDSTSYYNPVVVEQYLTIHSLQSAPEVNEFDSLYIQVNMPKRPDGDLEFDLSVEQFITASNGYSNPVYKEFILEFLELNNRTAHKYREKETSLLDRTNMIFGEEIEKNYSSSFPDNSTWLGYNSLRIFGIFMEECINKNPGIGHSLVSSINGKTNYLFPEDISTLTALVETYEKRAKK